MTPDDRHGPQAADFMDDYFAEAEEHIVAVRRGLLTLEGSLGSAIPSAAIEDLFRRFHSLKGISAMVELRDAELVAHQMESCLRAIRQEQLSLTPANFETLVEGAKVLEDVILAQRSGSAPPQTDDLIRQLEALARSGALSAGIAAPESPAAIPVRGARKRSWKVRFSPSPALVARGVKIDTIRGRLAQIGDVLHVAPQVVAGGGVSFEFDVETEDEAQLAAWHEDGVTYEPLSADSGTSGAPSIDGAQGRATGERRRDVAPAPRPTNFVRVDLARLDDLMRLVGDMVVTRARLDDTLQRVERHVPFQDWRHLQDQTAGLERQLRDLREGVMRVRLVPVGEIFRRMPFVVRDLARDSGKRVQLDLVGQSTEIDKFLIERMMDPVLHLVRNAISHAIETPEERIAAGKAPEGTIRLAAATAGESVVLEISDDGRGIDAAAVAVRARARGLAIPDGPVDERALLDIIASSGFSMRDDADRASGRGVGMAVVRASVEELGGALAVETTRGRGTTFRITLPLTLAVTDAIITHVGGQMFAVPQSAVREVIEVDTSAIRPIEHNELLTYRGGTLPIFRVATLFGIPTGERHRYHAIVVGRGLSAIGLLVDRIAGQREIVVKAINDPLIRVEGVSGATELGDGRLVLILDAAALSRSMRDPERPAEGVPA